MTTDLTPFRNSIVRIIGTDLTFAGLGYLVYPDTVLTCAHVVAVAIPGCNAYDGSAPRTPVRLNRPFSAEEKRFVTAHVLPTGWFPKVADDADEMACITDVAVLRLDKSLHHAYEKLAGLSSAVELTALDFAAYGGIAGHEKNLVPIYGVVGSLIGNGRYLLDVQKSAYRIEEGCSGGPVCSLRTGRVLGITVQREQDSTIAAGFMIAALELRKALWKARTGAVEVEATSTDALLNLRNRQAEHARIYNSEGATNLKRFIDNYRSVPKRPVPFVGREDVLADLDAWIANSPGSLRMVSSRAGGGKSALLLHWTARCQATSDAMHIVYCPISIRFGTSEEVKGLRLLHALLAARFPLLAFPVEAKPNSSDFRERIREAWTLMENHPNERFLLVCDGLDEAAGGWILRDIFPYEIPPNLNILLAARHRPYETDGRFWLDALHLGLEVPTSLVELQPLSQAAVSQAVALLGYPLDGLMQQAALQDRLYTLTDYGDPLLVYLWVTQLWERQADAEEITAETLRDLQPSFTGFIQTWLKEQQQWWNVQGLDFHRADLEQILLVLAVAQGALYLPELIAILEHLGLPGKWDYRTLRKVLDNTNRLIAGDGDQEPYVFVHPRIGDYFRDRMASAPGRPLQKIHRAFCGWGAASVVALEAGDLAAANFPEYLLRHYTTHIAAANYDDDQALTDYLLPLLRGGWYRAWDAIEGDYGSYLDDIDRIHQRLQSLNQKRWTLGAKGTLWIGEEVACLLIRSSISSMLAGVPGSLVAKLVKARLWSLARALRTVEYYPDPLYRVDGLIEIARVTQDSKICKEILERALLSAHAIKSKIWYAIALAAVAVQREGQPDLLEQALTVARGIEDDRDRAAAFIDIANLLEGEARVHTLHLALLAASSVSNERERSDTLVSVAAQLAGQPELLRQAHQIADTINNKIDRLCALAAVAGKLEGESRTAILRHALETAHGAENWYNYIHILEAVGQLEDDDFDFAQEIFDAALSINNEIARAEVLVSIARRSKGSPVLLRQILDAANDLSHEADRAKVFLALAGSLKGDFELPQRALAAAHAIRYEPDRVSALVDAADELEQEDRVAALRKALDIARHISDTKDRIDAIEAISARIESDNELLKQALEAARTIGDQRSRARVLATIAEHGGGDAGLVQQALDNANLIDRDIDRAIVLSEVAHALQGEPRRHILRQALITTQQADLEAYSRFALGFLHSGYIGISVILPNLLEYPEDSPALSQQVLDAACKIKDEWWRGITLEKIVGKLDGCPHLLHQALEAAGGLRYKELRAKALAAVADRFEGQARTNVLRQAVEAACAVEQEEDRGDALKAVAKHLTGHPELLQQVLTAARAIVDKTVRPRVLTVVAGNLYGDIQRDVLQQALSDASTIQDEFYRYIAVLDVAEHINGHTELLQQALGIAATFNNGEYRSEALAAVGERLEGQARTNVLRQAVEAACAVEQEEDRGDALKAVAKHLTGHPELLQQVLTAARRLNDASHQANALLAVSERLEGMERKVVLQEALGSLEKGDVEKIDNSSFLSSIASMPDYDVFRAAFRVLRRCPRETVLHFVGGTIGALEKLGRGETVKTITTYIVQVGQQWP